MLPFKSIGSEKDDEYLELGMADALITRLSNINGIVVRPTSSVSKYIGSEDEAVAVGRALAVGLYRRQFNYTVKTKLNRR